MSFSPDRCPATRACSLGLCLLVLSPGSLLLQQLPAATSATSVVTPRAVQGRVVDALHGTPVPRALVRLNARVVLSDAQGRFSFPQFTDAQAYASATKPGYSADDDGTDGPALTKVADLDQPVELKLFPDALLVGTLTAQDGALLAGISVQLYRANYDASGIAAAQVRYTVTDSRGNYRFQQPAGKYRVVTRYVGSLPETGQAVLAAAFPGGSSALDSGFFALQAGEEKRVNLRPTVGVAWPVELKINGAGEDDRRARVRVSVEAEGGVPFATQAQPTEKPGVYRILLPAGSYTLAATSGSREDPLSGTARITVSPRGTNHAELHLSEPALYPVELSINSSSAALTTQAEPAQPPTPAQLNLSLHSLDTNLESPGDLRLQTIGGGYAFRVAAGRYRLVSSGSSPWVVEAASLGAASLAGGELHVADSSAGTPIRLLVGNASGQINGTVDVGGAFPAWLYFIPHEPGLTSFYVERVGTSGAFSRSVPPGSYTLLAVANRIQEDLNDRSTLQALASAGKEVTVSAGATVTVQLPLGAAPTSVRAGR